MNAGRVATTTHEATTDLRSAGACARSRRRVGRRTGAHAHALDPGLSPCIFVRPPARAVRAQQRRRQRHRDRAGVVVGYGAEMVIKTLQEDLGGRAARVRRATRPARTGDAVAVGLTGLPDDDLGLDADDGDVVVLPGDTPLVRRDDRGLVREHRLSGAPHPAPTARIDDPTGYGRVVRDNGRPVRRIVEHRDADATERAIDEINTSIYVFRRGLLAPALGASRPRTQGELYVTDVVEVLAEAGHPVVSLVVDNAVETQGVNDRAQLVAAEASCAAAPTPAGCGRASA